MSEGHFILRKQYFIKNAEPSTVLRFFIQIIPAISFTSASVSFQPMQGSVMDLP